MAGVGGRCFGMIVLTFRHVVMRGQASRQMTCEKCRHAFTYVVAREVALDTVPFPPLIRRAEDICRQRLARRLARDVEPVACPACGWMGAEMVCELGRRYAGGLRGLGVAIMVACVALALACAAAGVYFHGRPKAMDVNWFGVSGVSLACGVLGWMLLGIRAVAGRLRYGGAGRVVG